MKRLISLLLTLLCLFAMNACTSSTSPPSGPENETSVSGTEQIQDTISDPSTVPEETTIPETSEPVELTIPSSSADICTRLPFTIGLVNSPDAYGTEVQMNRLVWDVENGTLSEPGYLYTFENHGVFDIQVDIWDGGDVMKPNIGTIMTEIGDNVTMVNAEQYGYAVFFGKYAWVNANQSLRAINEDGSYLEYPMPRNNPDLIVPDYNVLRDPHFATVIDDIGIVAYVICDDPASPAELVYGTFQVDHPEYAQWKTMTIPVEYAVDVFTNWNGAYSDGVLYLAGMDEILAIHLRMNQMEVLDRSNLLAPVFQAFPGYTTQYGEKLVPFVLEGSQNDTLIVRIPLYAPEGEQTMMYLAFRGYEILGAMTQHENGVLTFFDGEMNRINSTDEYQNAFLNERIQFARDD